MQVFAERAAEREVPEHVRVAAQGVLTTLGDLLRKAGPSASSTPISSAASTMATFCEGFTQKIKLTAEQVEEEDEDEEDQNEEVEGEGEDGDADSSSKKRMRNSHEARSFWHQS